MGAAVVGCWVEQERVLNGSPIVTQLFTVAPLPCSLHSTLHALDGCIASLQAAAEATHRLHPAASKFPATRLSDAVSGMAAAAALAALMSSANAYRF